MDIAAGRRSSLNQNTSWVQEQMVAMCGRSMLQALESDGLGQQPQGLPIFFVCESLLVIAVCV